MEERREPLLPPARHLLSVSPELMMPNQVHSREPRGDPIDRSHSAGERLIRPESIEYADYGRGFHAPEDILESMRGLPRRCIPGASLQLSKRVLNHDMSIRI